MTMRLRHVTAQTARRVLRRYPFLRRLSLVSAILILVWYYAIQSGERSTFDAHIKACQWDKWEEWPREAAPHHLVFVADPQLVDPHTYPGRPWPLSSLTETYTDLYMARNFRLINEKLDPDSVVFLGDLLDGGREWATSSTRRLKASQRDTLEKLGVLGQGQIEGSRDGKAKLYDFVPGENGRWAKWDDKQWNSEYERFGRIFFEPEQLYPKSARQLLPASHTTTHQVSVENGASLVTTQEYVIANGKHRQIMTSLPGNHDLGIGSGVQLSVRERFQSRFGETNNVYVLGNHTFVGVDVLSLAAYDEFLPEGGENTPDRKTAYINTWRPTNEFLNDLPETASSVVAESLSGYFPHLNPKKRLVHEVIDPKEIKTPKAKQDKSNKPQLPVILLSHVPLYRNPDTDCGKLREKGNAISISAGYQYQNVLTPTLSAMITKKVSVAGDIKHIFSGDDHDYCDITHRFNVGRWDEQEKKDKIVLKTIREITVKSFSWAMGVRHPGFLLASLWNPVDETGETIGTPLPTIQTHLCLLPDQLGLFISYAKLLGFTIVILLVRAIIVGLRNRPIFHEEDDEEEEDEDSKRLSLPHFRSRVTFKQNGTANGYASPKKDAESKGRQRASSTSMSTSSGNNTNLSVQRSYNARTRSVSPAANSAGVNYDMNAYGQSMPSLDNHDGPLIDKAGYYPQMRWQDPDESDEESHIGEDPVDSQAKWKKRRRPPSRARRVLDEFFISIAFVAIPAALQYGFTIRRG